MSQIDPDAAEIAAQRARDGRDLIAAGLDPDEACKLAMTTLDAAASVRGAPSFIPTPDQIAEACEAIQAGRVPTSKVPPLASRAAGRGPREYASHAGGFAALG